MFVLIYEYEGKFGYPKEKELSRKTLKGFENALRKLMHEKHIAMRYVSPNLQNNELISKIPLELW